MWIISCIFETDKKFATKCLKVNKRNKKKSVERQALRITQVPA